MIIIGYGLSFAIILAVILLAAGLIIWVIRSTKSKGPEKTQEISTAANQGSAALNPWHSPRYKRQMIEQARENEKTFIQAIKSSRLNKEINNPDMSPAQYPKLPEAK